MYYPPMPPRRRLSYWQLRQLVKYLPPPRTPEEYWQQEALRAEYYWRRRSLLWMALW